MSKHYRISVPIDKETRDAFQHMADQLGKSLGSTLADWLSETAEAAQMVANAMQKARKQPAFVLRQFQDVALELEARFAVMPDESAGGRGGDPARGEVPRLSADLRRGVKR